MTQPQKKTFVIIMFVILTLALACVGYFYVYSRGNSSSGIYAEERLASIVRTLYGARENSSATSITDLNNEYFFKDLSQMLPEDSNGRVKRFQYYDRTESWSLNIISVRYRNPRLARSVLAAADLMPSGDAEYLTVGRFSRTNLEEISYTARRGIAGTEEYTVIINYVEGDSLVFIQYTSHPTLDEDGRAKIEELCEALGVPVPPEPTETVAPVEVTDTEDSGATWVVDDGSDIRSSEGDPSSGQVAIETAASSATETTEGSAATAASETTI